MNPYKVLGVPNDSDKSICKKAYRKLCAKYHPDNGGDVNMFNKVNDAWKMIESGVFDNIILNKDKSFVIHSSLFRYKLAS